MAKIPTFLIVAAGALRDGEGRWLLQKRASGQQHAGLWEFPGGKVEQGETPRKALVRELNEELTITVDEDDAQPVAFAEEAPVSGRPAIVILLYKINAWEGWPCAEPGCEIGWYSIEEASNLPLPPLDVALLGSLRKLEQ